MHPCETSCSQVVEGACFNQTLDSSLGHHLEIDPFAEIEQILLNSALASRADDFRSRAAPHTFDGSQAKSIRSPKP